ncbi:NUDIX domain-containing protein [Actinotalea sp. M2MS4P-6]|uniref:NUDIX domain-containing protein n=1 Tax=Actinotalea sp. M2MS4P-6 TaxID=2983762 RepID=UPI0021E3AEE4|nr:NUDIX domain-containing protein [Actinotalea sp. M2MS4P-6]MCV2393512.1 NUDIX domain-containing protein [Actinotalea sp. M2MS4P-6]
MSGRPGLHRQAGDAWVECRCGRRHWGLHGAAGLLLARADGEAGVEVVLQHRVAWSDQGDTWGIPGGALAPGEDPVTGAIREAVEEAGIDAAALEVLTTRVLDHVDWAYTTVVARTTGPQDPRPTDPESEAIAWVGLDSVTERPLHSAFAASWPELRRLVER